MLVFSNGPQLRSTTFVPQIEKEYLCYQTTISYLSVYMASYIRYIKVCFQNIAIPPAD